MGMRDDIDAVDKVLGAHYRGLLDLAKEKARALRESARTDELTGITNRLGWEKAGHEQLAENIARYITREQRLETCTTDQTPRERNLHQISLILHDLDHFKAINDTYGHSTGDDVLRKVAQEELDLTRPKDILFARVGGEEFAVFLPETDLEGAIKVAERVREIPDGKPFTSTDGRDFNVTLSAGVATYNLEGIEKTLEVEVGEDYEGTTITENMLKDTQRVKELILKSKKFKDISKDIIGTLYGQADEALYVAKLLGRNQVQAYDEDTLRIKAESDLVRELYFSLIILEYSHPITSNALFEELPEEAQIEILENLHFFNKRERKGTRNPAEEADHLYVSNGNNLNPLLAFAANYLGVEEMLAA
jgi:diguanylate cyclase (GGDEF)-like protein